MIIYDVHFFTQHKFDSESASCCRTNNIYKTSIMHSSSSISRHVTRNNAEQKWMYLALVSSNRHIDVYGCITEAIMETQMMTDLINDQYKNALGSCPSQNGDTYICKVASFPLGDTRATNLAMTFYFTIKYE